MHLSQLFFYMGKVGWSYNNKQIADKQNLFGNSFVTKKILQSTVCLHESCRLASLTRTTAAF